MKKTFYSFFAIVGTSLFAITLANVSNINPSFIGNATECNHVGYHYNQTDATVDKSGHKEFYACCLCHQSWLDNPGGSFTDAEDSNMTGFIDEGHVAYIPKKQLKTINLVTNGGVFDKTEGTYVYGEEYKLPHPHKNDYFFEGWYLENTFKNKVLEIDTFSNTTYTLYARYLEATPGLTYDTYSKYLRLKSFPESTTELIIPDYHDDQKVVYIYYEYEDHDYYSPLFHNNSTIKKLYVGNNISGICEGIFCGMAALEYIFVPDCITTITTSFLAGCSKLTKVDGCRNVKVIRDGAFNGCGISYFYIPITTTTIWPAAFANCNSLTSVEFADPYNWRNDSTGAEITGLSNKSTAATYLTTTYANRKLVKVS